MSACGVYFPSQPCLMHIKSNVCCQNCTDIFTIIYTNIIHIFNIILILIYINLGQTDTKHRPTKRRNPLVSPMNS